VHDAPRRQCSDRYHKNTAMPAANLPQRRRDGVEYFARSHARRLSSGGVFFPFIDTCAASLL